jgi:hypothetical protein
VSNIRKKRRKSPNAYKIEEILDCEAVSFPKIFIKQAGFSISNPLAIPNSDKPEKTNSRPQNPNKF